MISISGLHKYYGNNHVLKGIDLQVPGNMVTAVLGPNGSGKTTLIKSLLGLAIPQEGNIEIDGKEISGTYQYRDQIGYLPQIARFPENLKVRELIEMVSDIRNKRPDTRGLMERFGLQEYHQVPLRQLSGGTRQKVNILLAFVYDSKYYILDEPTVGLDPVSLLTMKELIRSEAARKKTVLLTTHIINLVEEIADHIVFLLEGRIYFSGTKEELKSSRGTENLEKSIASILMEKGNV